MGCHKCNWIAKHNKWRRNITDIRILAIDITGLGKEHNLMLISDKVMLDKYLECTIKRDSDKDVKERGPELINYKESMQCMSKINMYKKNSSRWY